MDDGRDLSAFEVPRNGDSVLVVRRRGSLYEVDAVPRAGGSGVRRLFTSTLLIKVLTGAADGSIYADLADGQNAEVIRFSASGGAVETLTRVPEAVANDVAVLPDRKTVIGTVIAGRTHLVAIEQGKDATELLTTSEEVAGPFATNANEIAFAPDGSIYFGAGGSIWHADGGGAIQRITAGESVAASAHFLIVKMRENGKIRLVKVSPDGAVLGDVESAYPIGEGPLSSGAMDAGGRLLSNLAPVDSWMFVPAVTGESGRLERLAVASQGDFHSMAWTGDGRIVALVRNRRARIWRFRPEAAR